MDNRKPQKTYGRNINEMAAKDLPKAPPREIPYTIRVTKKQKKMLEHVSQFLGINQMEVLDIALAYFYIARLGNEKKSEIEKAVDEEIANGQ